MHTKPLAHRGLLTTKMPCPVVSALDLFSGKWKPLATAVSVFKPTALLFWTKWCRSSHRIMEFFVDYCERCAHQFSFVTCCVKSQESRTDHCQSVMDVITQKDWVRHDRLLHLCACHSESQWIKPLRRGVSVVPDVSELFGLVGVPTVVILDSSGCITWQGRCCCADASTFQSLMLHARAQAMGEQCAGLNCEQCVMDSELLEDRPERASKCTADSPTTSTECSQDAVTLHTRLHPGGESRGVHGSSGNRSRLKNPNTSRSGAPVSLFRGHSTPEGSELAFPVGTSRVGLLGKATTVKQPEARRSIKNTSVARQDNRSTKKISIDDFAFR